MFRKLEPRTSMNLYPRYTFGSLNPKHSEDLSYTHPGKHDPPTQLDGISKSISAKNPYIRKGNFLGILVFNPLPPSDSDWHTSQSTSSGLRRLNRGSCHTPKFAHIFKKEKKSKLFSKLDFYKILDSFTLTS